MTLIEVEFTWNQAFTAEQQALLREHSVNPVAFDAKGELNYASSKPVVTLDTLRQLGDVKATIVRVIDNASTRALRDFGQHNTTIVNEKCHVAVAGLGLLTVEHVKVVQDFCTEALQRELDAGWRILAVCVQPDQRRPDYVLGRSTPPGEQ